MVLLKFYLLTGFIFVVQLVLLFELMMANVKLVKRVSEQGIELFVYV